MTIAPPPTDAAPDTFLAQIGGPMRAFALANAFYDCVLADPLLLPLFADPAAPHADRMAWWLIELFGGEPLHTERRGGFATMVAAHRGLGILEFQRSAWVAHMLAAADGVGIEGAAFDAFADHIEQAARFAMAGSR